MGVGGEAAGIRKTQEVEKTQIELDSALPGGRAGAAGVGVIGGLAVLHNIKHQMAADRITALIVELRYNQLVLRRFKKSGCGIGIASTRAFKKFGKDYVLIGLFASDGKHYYFDRINNAYAYMYSRARRVRATFSRSTTKMP